jgi:septal ring factor EnvC (AmiA/AmiB activator)
MDGENKTKIKFQRQLNLQQTEDDLRKARNEIAELEIEMRKHRQDFTRAEMNLRDTESKLKNLRNLEFELNQRIASQKRAYLESM